MIEFKVVNLGYVCIGNLKYSCPYWLVVDVGINQ